MVWCLGRQEFRRRSDRVNKINCGGITARPPLVVDLPPPPRSAAASVAAEVMGLDPLW
jgi:hypothetical protein